MTTPDISQFELADPAPAGQLILSVRASDADRERAIGVLSEAFAEGRLTTEETAVPAVAGAVTGPSDSSRSLAGTRITSSRRRGRIWAPRAQAATRCGTVWAGAISGRRPEFDVMRAFVVAGLVVFHSAVVFAAGTSWFVTDPQPSAGFTVFLLWGSLWGMPLLFLISGMGAQYAMRTRPAAAFARERLARLGIPFAVGLAVLVPPMFYLEMLAQPAFHQSYWRFWLSFVNLPAIAAGLLPRGSWTSGGVTFDPAHLWFLYVLLVFSVALLPLFAYLRGPRGRPLIGRLAGFAERHGGVMVWAAAIPLMATEAVFGPDVNTGGWERATYVFPFLYGFLIASDSRFEAALRRSRWPALAVACAATGALLAWAGALSGSGAGLSGVPAGWSALQGLAGWAWTAAIMGFAGSVAARRAGRPPDTPAPPLAAPRPRWLRAARYANEAVLPFYLLHEPVIVAAAWLIVRWPAPVPAKYAVLVIVSFTATLGLYEALVRRFRLTRLLSGMKPRIKPATRHQAPPRTAEVDGSVASGWRSTPAASRAGPRR